MTQAIAQPSLTRLKRYLSEYRPQLGNAIAAIQTLEIPNADEESFSQALADLHVCATVLESYSEGMVDAIDQFVEDSPDEG
ncbi:hypothetical protein IQ265_05470 [Nodosilinea sp. LEGE 06152]|uniref:hypothetical protein n=1 Tax=Nodosilinea sp. LEGE 06152 TaxID=2777966 RepID=UPI0018823D72|nr:hypothetical protein [Nodosilinea sp. LEGE 06152]MBE9156281.1 hypothetical protein [Nodosilinea sp. LEGE 06152]